MTRKEETENAIKSHAPCFWDIDGKHYLMTYEEIRASHNGFRKGVEWADKNPKSPWISVEDDLPCNHEELLDIDDKEHTLFVVVSINGYIMLSIMYKFNDKWYWRNYEPDYWMLIPELPKTVPL